MLFPGWFTCICVAAAPLTDALFPPSACSCWAVCAWTSSVVWWLQVPSFIWRISRGSALVAASCQVPLWVSSALLCYSFCHWFGLHLYFAGFDTLLSCFLATHVYDFMLQAWSCWSDARTMHDGRQKICCWIEMTGPHPARSEQMSPSPWQINLLMKSEDGQPLMCGLIENVRFLGVVSVKQHQHLTAESE